MPVDAITPGLHARHIKPSASYHPGQTVKGELLERLKGDLWRIRLGSDVTTARLSGRALNGSQFQARVTAAKPLLMLQVLSSQGKVPPMGHGGLPSSAGLQQMAQMAEKLDPGTALTGLLNLNFTDSSQLSSQLSQFIQNFGHFFESRMSQVLVELMEAYPMLTPAQYRQHRGLLNLLEKDLKPLLIRMRSQLAGKDDALSRQLSGRIERMLNALGPEEGGLVTMPLPWQGGEARLEMRLPHRRGRQDSFHMAINIDSRNLGPLRISFWHTPNQLILRLTARNDETLQTFENELPELTRALQPLHHNVELRLGEWGEHVDIKPHRLDLKG